MMRTNQVSWTLEDWQLFIYLFFVGESHLLYLNDFDMLVSTHETTGLYSVWSPNEERHLFPSLEIFNV